MAWSAGQQRKVERAVHLVAGMLLLGYVYVPVPDAAQELVRYVLFPILVTTGMAMWQAARMRRYRRALVEHRSPGRARPSTARRTT